MSMTSYYMGVYADGEGKVFQVSNDIDCLSCELLASPQPFRVDYVTVRHMGESTKELSRLHGCSRLEINCSQGKGSYRLYKLT